jgi:hypothetical protein
MPASRYHWQYTLKHQQSPIPPSIFQARHGYDIFAADIDAA